MRKIYVRRLSMSIAVLGFALSASAYGAVTIAPLGSPRILVSDADTLAHLRGLLNSNAESAVRFKTMVDNQIAGVNNYYGFEPWYAALMGQITGVQSYCSYAVTQTEDFVASEEALIQANQRAHGCRRQLFGGRPENWQFSACLRLVSQHDDQRATATLEDLCQSGGMECVASSGCRMGNNGLSLERLVG